MEGTKDYSEQTRAIYHQQHSRIAADRVTMERFVGMFSTEYFGVPEDFFVGKRCLDAGCGDTAKLLISLYQMGARDLHGMDLGDEFIPVARQSIVNFGLPEDGVHFKSGSVVSLPYDDNEFDFVSCHGVLLHLNNMQEVSQALDELSRVTKPGGWLYTVYGIDGALFDHYLKPAMRKFYHDNEDFKRFVDNIKPEDIADIFDLITSEMKEQTGEEHDFSRAKEMFDLDFCVTIQNIIQAPVQLDVKAEFIEDHYRRNGFDELHKLKRYVKRKNIRKYFAPLHYRTDHWFAKIMYGNGSLEYLGRKRG